MKLTKSWSWQKFESCRRLLAYEIAALASDSGLLLHTQKRGRSVCVWRLSVGLFVCLLVTFMSHTEKAETIEMPFRWRKESDPPRERSNFGGCPPHWESLGLAVHRSQPSCVDDFNDLYVIWRVFAQGSAFLGSRWYCSPYRGWNPSKPPEILKLYAVKTTAPDPTKFFPVLMTTKYSVWVV